MPPRTFIAPHFRLIWRTLQIIGAIFLLVGLLDVATGFFPNLLGDPEWELGTTSHFFDAVPLLGLGVAFLLAGAVATGRRWQVRLIATFCVLVAVVMLLALLVYATAVPTAFKVVKDPLQLIQLKKAAAKTAVQAALYPFAMLWLAGAGWRASFGRRRG
ncbi:MAG: hypothetical protein ABI587_14530 [Gemmatimonadales bacterium]